MNRLHIITQVGDGRFKTTGQDLEIPNWQVLLKDSASALDAVMVDNKARELINL